MNFKVIAGNYDADKSREEYIAKMQAEGYRIVYPAPDELQIDMDTDEHFETFKHQVKILIREYPNIEYTINPSKNGLPGRHATIKMPFPMQNEERIAWQAAMGSDPIRELISLMRIKRGDNYPTIFVEIALEKGLIEMPFVEMALEEAGEF